MKITGSDNSNFKKDRLGNASKAAEKGKAAYASNSVPAKDPASTPQGAQGASEKILVSDLGKEVAKIHDQIKKAPDTRAE